MWRRRSLFMESPARVWRPTAFLLVHHVEVGLLRDASPVAKLKLKLKLRWRRGADLLHRLAFGKRRSLRKISAELAAAGHKMVRSTVGARFPGCSTRPRSSA